jgi:hypothetical protein
MQAERGADSLLWQCCIDGRAAGMLSSEWEATVAFPLRTALMLALLILLLVLLCATLLPAGAVIAVVRLLMLQLVVVNCAALCLLEVMPVKPCKVGVCNVCPTGLRADPNPLTRGGLAGPAAIPAVLLGVLAPCLLVNTGLVRLGGTPIMPFPLPPLPAVEVALIFMPIPELGAGLLPVLNPKFPMPRFR